jgi:hypothetical protein
MRDDDGAKTEIKTVLGEVDGLTIGSESEIIVQILI